MEYTVAQSHRHMILQTLQTLANAFVSNSLATSGMRTTHTIQQVFCHWSFQTSSKTSAPRELTTFRGKEAVPSISAENPCKAASRMAGKLRKLHQWMDSWTSERLLRRVHEIRNIVDSFSIWLQVIDSTGARILPVFSIRDLIVKKSPLCSDLHNHKSSNK